MKNIRFSLTNLLIGINLILFILAKGLELFSSPDGDLLAVYLLGANITPLVTTGDFFQLITAVCLHTSILHLLFNMYALYIFGTMLEHIIGPAKYLILYLLTGFAGSLLSYIVHDVGISLGASGAIYGIIGATAFLAYRLKAYEMSRSYMSLIAINILFSILNARIDLAAHMGGLILGILLVAGGRLVKRVTGADFAKYVFTFSMLFLVLLGVGNKKMQDERQWLTSLSWHRSAENRSAFTSTLERAITLFPESEVLKELLPVIRFTDK